MMAKTMKKAKAGGKRLSNSRARNAGVGRNCLLKRPAGKTAASVSVSSHKSGLNTKSSRPPLWKPLKVSLSFVSRLELQRERDQLEGHIQRMERQLKEARAQLARVEKSLNAADDKLREELGDPTGRVLNVSVSSVQGTHGVRAFSACCRFLSGETALMANLPMDATVADLQDQVCQNLDWSAVECADAQASPLPMHAELQASTELILKEMTHREDKSDMCYQRCNWDLSERKVNSGIFLQSQKLPLQYSQDEHWEDDQGVGGDATLKLDFRASKCQSILKFGKLIGLQDVAGINLCEKLVNSSKYQGVYKPPYGYFNEECGKDGPKIVKHRGPSRIEVVEHESRLKKIITSLAEETEAFAGADWDSVAGWWHADNRVSLIGTVSLVDWLAGAAADSSSANVEVQRRLRESRNVMKAALAWIEKFCTAGSMSAVYVRLEHGERTYRQPRTSSCYGLDVHDDPGRSIVDGVGVLFLRAESGEMARLSLQKHVNDFAGSY